MMTKTEIELLMDVCKQTAEHGFLPEQRFEAHVKVHAYMQILGIDAKECTITNCPIPQRD